MVASGRDIYAVSAPLVVAAAGHILGASPRRSGVVTAGALADARELLTSLDPRHLTVELPY
ncbi:hypothetical protein ACN27F_23420 [Solwaraspora sp. WMMB335]|uniref:hypothetical protein n=1 Tax=Solwaraspora sp. WMMB335 TaxID=3404118 RepID=UPI003B933323